VSFGLRAGTGCSHLSKPADAFFLSECIRHRSFLRPITTLIILLLAGTRQFVHTHPLSDGIFKFMIAAIVTFVIEARDIILAELSSKHPRMVYHTE
jgi:hypothetical protein